MVIVVRSFFFASSYAEAAGRPGNKAKAKKYPTMSSDDKGSAAAPKRVESDVYDRQIRLWGADAQVGVVLWLVSSAITFCAEQ